MNSNHDPCAAFSPEGADFATRQLRRLRLLLPLFLILPVAGCGSALHGTLPARGWTEVGLNQFENPYDEPTPDKYRYVTKTAKSWAFHTRWWYDTETLTAGTGLQVKPGDLVKIRLRVLESSGGTYNGDLHEMMVYVGRTEFENREESAYRTAEPLVSLDPGFSLGSARIRRALVGHRVGERFVISRPDHPFAKASLGEDPEWVPFKAIVIGAKKRFLYPYPIPVSQPPIPNQFRLPLIELSGDRIRAEIEVVESCPAKLLVSEVRAFEAGVVVRLRGGSPDTFRSSLWQQAAVEAQCAGAPNPIRIEAGPISQGVGDTVDYAPDTLIPVSDAEYESIGQYWGESFRLRPVQ